MPRASANGVELEYETFGEPSAAPLLLVSGLGAQMVSWDEEFCAVLAGRGFFVIRFDNRDVGLSSRMEAAGLPDLSAVLTGQTPPPYRLTDMAGDAAGLLDALGIGAAHVTGASMGGYIAQLLTLHHPERVLSLTAIITGPAPREGVPAKPEGAALLMTPPATTYEGRIAQSIGIRRTLVGGADPIDEEVERRRAIRAYERGFYPAGTARQLMATLSADGWLDRLRSVRVPALVIGGRDDILIPVENSRRIAEALPDVRLIEVEGMGHDLPRRVWAEVADAMAGLARLSATPC